MTGLSGCPRIDGMKLPQGIARRLLLGAALLGLALPALPQATTPAYSVEIIVFRHGGDAGALDANAPRPLISGDDVVPVPATSRKLGGAATGLNRNGMRVIGQASWRQEPASWNSRRGVSTARLGIPGVTGKVIFERGRFLHLGVDLVVEDGGKRYRIDEVRQVKTDEIQYFDHPAVGVIAVVSGG